jgi:hypothetical protein
MRFLSAIIVSLFPSLLLAQTPPQRWRLVETLRIGSADGPYSLTTVNGILPSRDGRLVYVMQRKEATIRVFDSSTGKFVLQIGRAGEGPGEFRGLNWIGWKQDTLYAVDGNLQRVSMFSSKGEHLRTERIVSAVLAATHRPASVSALNADGTVIGESVISMFAVAKGLVTSNPVVLMTREGEIIRTLAERNLRNTMVQAAVGNRVAVFRQPMSEGSIIRYAPDGSSLVIVGRQPSAEPTARFHVTRLGSTGDTIYHKTYRYSPRPVPAAMVDSIYDQYAKMFATVPPARARKAAESFVVLPPALPPISDVVFSSDGTTWLRQEEIMGRRTVQWLVLSPSGDIQSVVQAPSELKLLAVEKGAAWGVITDELDIPYVVRYALQR